MPKVKISEYSATANSNTDVASINIDEGCAPSGINNAIRAVMGHLKDFQQGTYGDPFNGPVNGTVGATTPASGAFTTLSATGNVTLGDASTDTLNVGNGGLIKDSSGNLGLGVTPSAWSSSFKVLQLANGTSLSNNGQTSYYQLGANNYYDGSNYKYIASNFAGFHRFSNAGAYEWHIAPSGTAGNAITFTQAMTLDASGNLGIGTTSPLVPLHVVTTGTGTTMGSNTVATFRSGASGRASTIQLSDGTTSNYVSSLSGSLGFGSAGTELMRLDSSGNLLVGITSATSKLTVNGEIGVIDNFALRLGSNQAGGATLLYNNNGNLDITPRLGYNTVVTSGNLLVGGTTQLGKLTVETTTAGTYTGYNRNTNATPGAAVIDLAIFSAASPNNTTAGFYFASDNVGAKAIIYSNGGLHNYSANNVNLSDRREKTNFVPAGDYLAKICAIPVQTFNYIDQNMEDDGGLTLGVVAQDVQAVAPELVMESNWAGKDEEPKMRLSIYQTDLQYALMKCIQEQQSLITQLTARITALEGA